MVSALATATFPSRTLGGFSFDGAAGRPSVAMRRPSSLNSRPDTQSQRGADDHARGDLGASADQNAEDDADRRTNANPNPGG